MSASESKIDRAPDTWLVGVSAAIGIAACLGDLFMTHLLGTWYPGYRPLYQPMSDLGGTGSPVASVTSTWWTVMGLMFVAFGFGYFRAFWYQGKHAHQAAWMIALYGIGEGLGSSLVPETPGEAFWTPGNLIHGILGAVGVLAAIALPFIIMKIANARQSRWLYRYSWFTSITGIAFIFLFAVCFLFKPAGGWISCCGLWQRLFMLVYYSFFVCLASLMLTRRERIYHRRGAEGAEKSDSASSASLR